MNNDGHEIIDPEGRAQRAAKYAAWWQLQQAKQLHRDRAKLVHEYRKKSGPSIWPDGICSKDNPWYQPQDWNDQGKWIASHQPPWLAAAGLTLSDLKEKPITPANTVADVTKALAKLTAKPVTKTVTENTPAVTENVTINTPSVTINTPVTETHGSTKTHHEAPFSVTPKPRGRPPSDAAMSAAERMRAYRQRLKTSTTLPSSL